MSKPISGTEPAPGDRETEAGPEIAVLLFDRITALDAIGPYEVLSRLPGAVVRFVALERGPQRADTGFLTLTADYALDEVLAPDIVVVPGGPGSRDLVTNTAVLDWVRTVHRTSRWTTSVCTGALILGAAGILEGGDATTHWAALDQLAGYGAVPTESRIVSAGKILTAAGVSAGIDLGLHIVELVAGEQVAKAIQLIIEYDSRPGSERGPASTASAQTVALARHLLISPFASASPDAATLAQSPP